MLYDIEVVTGALRRIRIQLLATPHAGRPLIAGNVQAITQNRKGNGSVHGKKKNQGNRLFKEIDWGNQDDKKSQTS